MTNENLRMQMLSGIITESEYKTKLEENAASNLELKSLAKQLYMGFKKLGATTKFQTTKMTVGSKGAFTDNNVNIFVDNDTIQVDINSKGIGVPKAEELKNNIKKSFPKVILTPQQGGSDWEGNKIISFALTPGKEMSESLDLQEAEPGNLMLSNAAKQIYQYIKSNKYDVMLLIGGKKIGNPNAPFQIQAFNDKITVIGIGPDQNTVKDTMTKLQNLILGHFNFLEKNGELQVNYNGIRKNFNGTLALHVKPDMLKTGKVTETLNENFVGIPAINNVFEREKTDYELAFEHFTKSTSILEDYDKASQEMEEESLHQEESEELEEGMISGLYTELKNVLFPYYTDLTGEERIAMIDDIISELNAYIGILQGEKTAK
jgi:hypothetical protein